MYRFRAAALLGIAIFLLTGCATTRGHTLEEVKDAVAAAAAPTPLPPLSKAQRDCLPAPTSPVTIVNPDGTRTYPLQSVVGGYITDLEKAGADCRSKHKAVVSVYDAAEARSRAIPPANQ